MAPWTPFPHAGDYAWDATRVQQQWSQLHLGDAEPLPQDPAVLHAWVLFHNGEFQKAVEAGLAAGGAGITAANKATAVYATYLEPREQTRLGLFMQIAERAQAQAAANAQHANAWYWQAYALGRYSQGISVAKALAQGLGGKVKESLEKAIALSPKHADARIALGAFHAEVIDKVGKLLGRTQGADAATLMLGLYCNVHQLPGVGGQSLDHVDADDRVVQACDHAMTILQIAGDDAGAGVGLQQQRHRYLFAGNLVEAWGGHDEPSSNIFLVINKSLFILFVSIGS